MTRRFLFTVDLDRDVNIQLEGRPEAGSIDRGQGTAPRFASAERGLHLLLDLLDDIGMKATFFVEGRTAQTIDCSVLSGHCIGFHGYDHEDMAKLNDPLRAMSEGYRAVKDNVSAPVCFRAPYMSADDRTFDALRELNIKHDSSVYSDPGTAPYDISGITEHPVAKGKDRAGRTIAAYLWPLHEGKRIPSDYVELALSSGDNDFILATHTWHLVERRDSGPMSEEDVRRNISDVREALTGIIDSGYRPSGMV